MHALAAADVDAPIVIEFELPQDRAADALRGAVANGEVALKQDRSGPLRTIGVG